ncbi:MAG: DUF4388 domain-containing protein [Acidobacteriota bacterium]
MAIEGDLKDISLTGLVQVVCLERRTAELVLTRRGEEGVIFFDKGEIVHAKTGYLVGEEALFRMLSWGDGAFRITDKVTVLTKTILVNWNHLLMEGMRRIDERKRNIEPPPIAELPTALSAADIERDTTLRNDLILLIAKLEQYIPRFAEKKIYKRPSLALELMEEIVNQVVEISEMTARGDLDMSSLKGALIKIYEKYPQARVLHIENNRISVQTAVSLHNSWASDPVERKYMFRQISHALIEILNYYFSFLASRLQLANVREEIEEIDDVFIADLKRALDVINF